MKLAQGTGTFSAAQPQQQGPPASEYVIVRTQDFGIWSYGATRSDTDPLHAAVNYKFDNVEDILAYAAANKALLPEVISAGGRADVAITFVYPVGANWYREFARRNGFRASSTQMGSTVSISGNANDPLPPENMNNMGLSSDSDDPGIFGAYGSVDAAQITGMVDEPLVFLVDVTPTWVRLDMARAGVKDEMLEPVQVALAYGYMERLGLQNFTRLPLPTPISTYIPTILPVPPDQ